MCKTVNHATAAILMPIYDSVAEEFVVYLRTLFL